MQDAPKLKAAIVGSGLAGLSTAVELLDQGYAVDIYESRPFIGGKVASWQKDGNHVEMGLHVVSILSEILATRSAMQRSRISGCVNVFESLAPLLAWSSCLNLQFAIPEDYAIVTLTGAGMPLTYTGRSTYQRCLCSSLVAISTCSA